MTTNEELLRHVQKLQFWLGMMFGLCLTTLIVALLTCAMSGYVFLVVHNVVEELRKLGVG